MDLPANHRPYTDKYFIRTRQILMKAKINPKISIAIFARGCGRIAGLNRTAGLIHHYAPKTRILATIDSEFQDMQPLLVIEARVQDIVELETMYLGVLSDALSRANGISEPDAEYFQKKFGRLKEIYPVPMTYFGARHYHYKDDKMIARAAITGGCSHTSTDIGSSIINEKGVGTMPHVLPIVLAAKYSRDKATLLAAKLFDRYIEPDVPRVTLVDTFNRELTDSLAAAEYYGRRTNMVRLDTCSESIGEGCTGAAGVTVELVRKVREKISSYPDCGIFLSGGFGDEGKAAAFMQEFVRFKKETGQDLFNGVGIGAVSDGIFCTADIFKVGDTPISKTGRQFEIDYSRMKVIK